MRVRDDAEVFDQVQAALERMTDEEIFQSVIASGVLTPDGKLAEPYASAIAAEKSGTAASAGSDDE